MRPLEAFWAAKIKITQNTKRDKESISFLKISDMTKRVPLNNFTADDGNPDDKRPRLDDEENNESEPRARIGNNREKVHRGTDIPSEGLRINNR